MGVRKNIHLKFEEIEQKHGRITKSIFVISHWIMESKRFEYMSRKSKNIDTLNYILKHREEAIEEMLKTNLLNIRIYKPNQNENSWIYMLYIEREGTINIALQSKTTRIHGLLQKKEKNRKTVLSKRRQSESNWSITVLQTGPLPLGYSAMMWFILSKKLSLV